MLEELKKVVCEANLNLDRWKLVTLTWGNVSGIDRERGLVVIKPSGVDYAATKPETMVVVELSSGKVVEGNLRPSSDTPTHLVLYRAFHDVGGIAHTHSTYASAFAQAGRSIPPLGTTHADLFHGDVPITRLLFKREVENDYEINTGHVIVERMAKFNPMVCPGILVANHGPFTWGVDAVSAACNSLALEEIARMAFITLTLNPQTTPMPSYLLDKHYRRKHGPHAYYGQIRPK